MNTYINRHRNRYNINTSVIKRFYLQHLDFSTRALMTNKNAMHCILYIGDQIGAFCSGYIDKGKYVVPRLSIDDRFARYSPGYVLINEVIKMFSNDTLVHTIDLSEGAEKYKIDLGGRVYQKIDFELTRM